MADPQHAYHGACNFVRSQRPLGAPCLVKPCKICAHPRIDLGGALPGARPVPLGRARRWLEQGLGSRVDLVTAAGIKRQVRDQITTETWERLNLIYLRMSDPEAGKSFAEGSQLFLHDTIADQHLFKGAGDATMTHGGGW